MDTKRRWKEDGTIDGNKKIEHTMENRWKKKMEKKMDK